MGLGGLADQRLNLRKWANGSVAFAVRPYCGGGSQGGEAAALYRRVRSGGWKALGMNWMSKPSAEPRMIITSYCTLIGRRCCWM